MLRPSPNHGTQRLPNDDDDDDDGECRHLASGGARKYYNQRLPCPQLSELLI